MTGQAAPLPRVEMTPVISTAHDVARETLPRNARVRARVVASAAEKLKAERVGHRLWFVDGRFIGTTRMVALANTEGPA